MSRITYVSEKPNNFRTPLGADIFTKYALTPDETWLQRCKTVVDDVCGTVGGTQHPLMSEEDRRDLVHFMHMFVFLPGGRYLYYGGREVKFYNNCASGDTELLCSTGKVRMRDVAGSKVKVLSPVDGNFYPAVVHNHGTQPLYEITFGVVGRSHKSRWAFKEKFTRDHKWYLADGSTTEHLSVGDVVPANAFSAPHNEEAWLHGFFYGDGGKNGSIRLCGAKSQYAERFRAAGASITQPVSSNGDRCAYLSGVNNGTLKWKSLPKPSATASYRASFIRGWLAADGSDLSKNTVQITSVDSDSIQWFIDNAAFAGLLASKEIKRVVKDKSIGSYFYPDHILYYGHAINAVSCKGLVVESIEYVGEEEVYCPDETVHHQIVIGQGIHTGNCFLFKAEEDTREEWGRLLHVSSDALMSGGGIGIDYSVLRARHSLLRRTGGTASGPLPLALSIDAHGANVRQGGGRRSAIYGSLNWAHDDAPEWLKVKDWANIKVPGTNLTYMEARTNDFDVHAPLAYTNISLNYDNAFLGTLISGSQYNIASSSQIRNIACDRKAWSDIVDAADLPSTFFSNVEMSMRNGEPGFSFNFFTKEKETLRNACCEIVSEDDSDVCNLGSVNMAACPDKETFERVVELGSKFLVCGTIRGQLPTEKIRRVREKNRRLGLGLMGMHEWLLQRGHRYEMNPELRDWLGVYATVSEEAAKEHCDRFFISHPVAYRAIAPTGSIGTMAGTTTGMEPVFGVAYKRRYIKGDRTTGIESRKYQYYVDAGAQDLIDRYGIDPDTIETSLSLSLDPERRIAFQADVQEYVDQAISSTLNLPAWGSEGNNEDTVPMFARLIAKYAPRLRGLTMYPDGSRGGQPLVPVPYEEAKDLIGTIFEENSDTACKSGVCGI
jgi:ribonucleoside-diphosphate reductase alpha chain